MDTLDAKLGRDDRGTPFATIARRIGRQLRDLYPHPESEPIPAQHIQMLLELRHKERNNRRRDAD